LVKRTLFMEVGSDGVAGKTLEESFERVSAKAMLEPLCRR